MSDRVCLLITTWNRTALLRESLAQLARFTLPDEVLVVDDGGTDGCDAMVREFSAQVHGRPSRSDSQCDVRYLYTHNPIEAQCSHARNVGLRNTECEVVITSEPEMLWQTDVVAQMYAAHLERPNQVINVGRVLHGQDPTEGGFCPCCGQQYHVTVNWSATWIALYRREWLLRIGGWDEHFPDPWGWDDVDLSTRLRITGIGQYNDPEISAIHQWHPPRRCEQSRNEAYFRSKAFHGNESPDHPALVANQGHEWGSLQLR